MRRGHHGHFANFRLLWVTLTKMITRDRTVVAANPILRAKGYHRLGDGSAHNNLVRQIPKIALEFPEIQGFYAGTINVRFEPKIIVAGWDHRTPPIIWDNGQTQGEVFDLVRVRLLFNDLSAEMEAFLYVSHWTIHRHDPHMHEFIGERFVEGLRHGMEVVMEFSGAFIDLPYRGGYKNVIPYTGKPRFAQTLVILPKRNLASD
jgi:hypothetical protein